MTYVLILGLLVPLMSACDVTLPVADLKTETGDETVVSGDTDTGSGTIAKGEAEIDTSDWQTYRNKEYGFEVKYPLGWNHNNLLHDSGNGYLGSIQFWDEQIKYRLEGSDVLPISISISDSGLSTIDEYLDSIRQKLRDFESLEKKIFDGKEVVIRSGYLGSLVTFFNKGRAYSINRIVSFPETKPFYDLDVVYKGMLESFVFVE